MFIALIILFLLALIPNCVILILGAKHKMKLITLTNRLGYKSLKETTIEVEYSIETVENDLFVDLLGNTSQEVVFTRFDVSGVSTLINEVMASYPAFTYDRAMNLVYNHLIGIVSEYLKTGDTLTKGAGLLGAHQYCYVIDSVAYQEHLRCEAFKAKRKELSV